MTSATVTRCRCGGTTEGHRRAPTPRHLPPHAPRLPADRAGRGAAAVLGARGAVGPGARAVDRSPSTPALPAPPGTCDDLDTRTCLLPFPSDTFTTLDASTPTGRRVDLDLLEMPRNVAGKPVDPTEWNLNDGFSPGTPMLTFVPGLDLTRTFELDATPETGPDAPSPEDPWAVRDGVPDALLEAPGRSMRRNAPIVLLDADTGKRHPVLGRARRESADPGGGCRPDAGHPAAGQPRRGAPLHRRAARPAGREGATIPAAAAFAALRDGWSATAGPRAPATPAFPGPRRPRPGRPGRPLRRRLHPARRARRRRARPPPGVGLPRRLGGQPGRPRPRDP